MSIGTTYRTSENYLVRSPSTSEVYPHISAYAKRKLGPAGIGDYDLTRADEAVDVPSAARCRGPATSPRILSRNHDSYHARHLRQSRAAPAAQTSAKPARLRRSIGRRQPRLRAIACLTPAEAPRRRGGGVLGHAIIPTHVVSRDVPHSSVQNLFTSCLNETIVLQGTHTVISRPTLQPTTPNLA